MAKKLKPERRPDPSPLEVDDVLIVGGGSILFLLVGIGMLPFWNQFKDAGHLWWIATAFAGAVLGGGFGLPVVLRRRSRMRAGSTR